MRVLTDLFATSLDAMDFPNSHYPNNSSLPGSRPDIPPDIVTDILSRLPIKSLLRFQRVCKQWRNSIFDPQFALSYQNQKTAIRYDGRGLFDLNIDSESDRVSLAALCGPMRKKNIASTEEVEMPRLDILGSCKGFVLIKHDMDLHLWNPSTRQCAKVVSLPQSDRFQCLRQRVLNGSGLCYDSSTDDYKAVMDYEGMTVVVSLKSRRWTSFCLPYALSSGPEVNERLHWMVNRDENGMQFPTPEIVYFDPPVDEFLEVPALPNQGKRNILLGLGVLDGCLCVARCGSGYISFDYEPNIEVLIMKEYGVGESWTSVFVMFPFMRLPDFYVYESLVPLRLRNRKNGKAHIAVNGENIVACYNLERSQRSISAPIKNCVRNVFSYEESLISPHLYGGGNDWRIKQVDAWNLVYDSDWCRNYLCVCCAYDFPLLDDMISEGEEDDIPNDDLYDWEEDDMLDDNLYDWKEEEYFLKKQKERHRMRLKTKNL